MKRPVSITLIALWFFLGVALDLHALLTSPLRLHFVLVLGLPLRHYSAVVAFAVYIQLGALIGIGLLDLRPGARLTGIVFCAYKAVNTVIASFLSGSDRFVTEIARQNPRMLFDPNWRVVLNEAYLASVFVAVGLSLLVLYFLVTRRGAFYPPHAPTAVDASTTPGATPAHSDSSAPQQNSDASSSAPPAGQGGTP